MYICPSCGFKYLIAVYEAERHIFLRCPNKSCESCGKLETRMKQLEVRGKVIKRNGIVVEVNVYDGDIEGK